MGRSLSLKDEDDTQKAYPDKAHLVDYSTLASHRATIEDLFRHFGTMKRPDLLVNAEAGFNGLKARVCSLPSFHDEARNALAHEICANAVVAVGRNNPHEGTEVGETHGWRQRER